MNATNFELKKGTEVTLENVKTSVAAIQAYVTDKNIGEWIDYKIHEYHLKKALPIDLISDLYHLDYYNGEGKIKDISLVYDSYSGQIGIWSEKFGCNQNETYLELQMDFEEEGYLEATVEMYLKLLSEI